MTKQSTLAYVAEVRKDGSLGTPISRDTAGMVARATPSAKARRAKAELATDALSAASTTDPQVPAHVQARIAYIASVANGAANEARQGFTLARAAATTARYIMAQTGLNTLPEGKWNTWSGDLAARARDIFDNERGQVLEGVRSETERHLRNVYRQEGLGSELAKDVAKAKAKAKANTYRDRFTKAIYDIANGDRDVLTGEVKAKDGDASTGDKARTTRAHRKTEEAKHGKLGAKLRELAQAAFNAYVEADKAEIVKADNDGTMAALNAYMDALGLADD